MAAVALTGAGNVTTTSSTSAAGLTGNKPTNTADGDVLWAMLYHRNASGTITGPAGWTIHKNEGSNGTYCLATKPIPQASAESATTYAFNSNQGSARCMLAIGRITGAHLQAQPDAVGTAPANTGTASLVHPAVTAVAVNTLLIAVSSNNTTVGTIAAFTADAAMTEVAQVGSNTGAATSNMQVSQQPLSASGSTGTRTATMSPSAANSSGVLVTLVEVPAGRAALVGVAAAHRAASW